MEVTTVSPSPVSPTEGDHLCETDVTTVATHSVTLLICLCGLAGNGAVIGLLGLKGDKFIIQNLAVIDFLILLLTFPSALLFLVEDVSCSPILPLVYLRFLFRLSVVSCYWGPFWVTSFSIEVGIEMLLELCYRRDLPEELFFLVMSVQFWAFSALLSEAPTVTLLCPANEQEHCRAALIAVWAIILLLFVVPMTVLVIYSTIALIKARCGSQQKQPKGRDIVIVFTGPFTLLFLLWNFLQELGYIVVPSHFFFLLTCIYSSIKPFIYFLAGRCWRSCSVESLRLSLQRVFEDLE
ncbi:mas-related G-protein coupled receptor member H-like [Passer domesticus]|uniref:mas-related G-protein coupled receptor member H-like n=1 Tax=Passer domesticus TaxID=48849 RepID=UPI0030FF361A